MIARFPDMTAGSLPALDALLLSRHAIEHAHSLNPGPIIKAIEGFTRKQYPTSANALSFPATTHDGWTQTQTCSLLPLGRGLTPWAAESVTQRQPIG